MRPPSTVPPVPGAGVGPWELCRSCWQGRFGSSAVTVLPAGRVSRGAGQGLPGVILPAAVRPECQGKLRHGWGN